MGAAGPAAVSRPHPEIETRCEGGDFVLDRRRWVARPSRTRPAYGSGTAGVCGLPGIRRADEFVGGHRTALVRAGIDRFAPEGLCGTGEGDVDAHLRTGVDDVPGARVHHP